MRPHLTSVDPSTGERWAEVPVAAPAEVEAALTAAEAAAARWAHTPLEQRLRPLLAVAAKLREQAQPLAELMAREMGKPLREGLAEVAKCAWVCEHYAAQAASYLADEPITSDATRSLVVYEPLGVLLSIMPWNFPLWQVFRAAAPGLAAGNALLLKHASNVPGCALAIERLWREAGLAEGLFQALLLPSAAVGPLIDDPRVAAVSLTGSTPAGRAVAARAGAALKPCVLELGGSDPYLVLEDADLEACVEACATARLLNCGQSCIAAKRFIVVRPVLAEFEQRLVARMARVRQGSPLDPATELGPMARPDLRAELHAQVQRSLAAGARLLLGGVLPPGPGAFYPPTVLSAVGPGMAAADEELFGPVAAILPAADEAEALRLANGSSFGLGAAVFTRDAARGERLARGALQAGCCFVNGYVRSDPRLPFGGVKQSGFGRELGRAGIHALCNIKTIWVA